MTTISEPDTQSEIRQRLHEINVAWINGRPEELAALFHEDIVVVLPGFQDQIWGRAAAIASYDDFANQATIHEYREEDHRVEVWGDTAVASYRFEIAYELDGEGCRDTGRDLFVFTRQHGQWLVVWRTLLADPAG